VSFRPPLKQSTCSRCQQLSLPPASPSPTNTRLDSDGSIVHGHNGGVWEWTSSEFNGLKGYEQSQIYPGFSSDFFDGLHNVVVGCRDVGCAMSRALQLTAGVLPYQMGGSFATIPRLAARSSWRNFYQMLYPYAWIGGRVAYDV
jgi:formylglycine-generating enzyme required for sulfatase activity